jgi:hypothetical protein
MRRLGSKSRRRPLPKHESGGRGGADRGASAGLSSLVVRAEEICGDFSICIAWALLFGGLWGMGRLTGTWIPKALEGVGCAAG